MSNDSGLLANGPSQVALGEKSPVDLRDFKTEAAIRAQVKATGHSLWTDTDEPSPKGMIEFLLPWFGWLAVGLGGVGGLISEASGVGGGHLLAGGLVEPLGVLGVGAGMLWGSRRLAGRRRLGRLGSADHRSVPLCTLMTEIDDGLHPDLGITHRDMAKLQKATPLERCYLADQASSGDLSSEIWMALAMDPQEQVVQALASRAQVSEAVADVICGRLQKGDLVAFLRRASTKPSAATLEGLSQSGERMLRRTAIVKILNNSELYRGLLEGLDGSDWSYKMWTLALNIHNLPQNLLVEASTNKDPRIRRAVAGRAGLPGACIDLLKTDTDPGVLDNLEAVHGGRYLGTVGLAS